MRKETQTDTRSRLSRVKRLHISRNLTPRERQALWLVSSLFLLGVLVRWYRLAHLS
jgi:hypothetical protein